MLALTLVGGQFRSYILGIGCFFAFLLIFSCYGLRRLTLYFLTVVTVVAGFLAFPSYRAIVGIDFFVPNVNSLMLVHASYVAWDLDKRSQSALDGVVLDPEIRRKLVSSDPIELPDVLKMVDDLVAEGRSRAEAS